MKNVNFRSVFAKVLFLSILLVGGVSQSVYAGKPKKDPTAAFLSGIWRSYTVQKDSLDNFVYVPKNVFKVYNAADQSFKVFLVEGGVSFITVEGTFKTQGEKRQYEELVEHNYGNATWNNSVTRFRYKELEQGLILFEYCNSVQDVWVPELWKRVEPIRLNGQQVVE